VKGERVALGILCELEDEAARIPGVQPAEGEVSRLTLHTARIGDVNHDLGVLFPRVEHQCHIILVMPVPADRLHLHGWAKSASWIGPCGWPIIS